MAKSKALKRKEITFDLDVNELRAHFGDTSKKTKKYTKAYRELKKFFSKRDFEHRQGSVYCSNKGMQRADVYELVDELKKECPWLTTSLKRMDVADIGELHELTSMITT